jgi:hypothetical protein
VQSEDRKELYAAVQASTLQRSTPDLLSISTAAGANVARRLFARCVCVPMTACRFAGGREFRSASDCTYQPHAGGPRIRCDKASARVRQAMSEPSIGGCNSDTFGRQRLARSHRLLRVHRQQQLRIVLELQVRFFNQSAEVVFYAHPL